MKKTLTIAEARELFASEKVFATNSGFLFNDIGKYRTGLTFVLDSSFELDKDGEVVSPIQFVDDREVTDSFNLDLDGDAKILFGDFWKSQKGAPCFRPKAPNQAKHLLVDVRWGGCFNSHRGNWSDDAKAAGALYFRRASSNGGGAGHDYWVLPVGYVRQLEGVYRIDWEAAREYCSKHSKLQADQRTEADRLYREKKVAEAESLAAKSQLLPRLLAAKSALESLPIYCSAISIPEDAPYFLFSNCRHYYNEESLTKIEVYLAEKRAEAKEKEAEELTKRQRWEEILPCVAALKLQAKELGIELVEEDNERISLRRDNREIAADSYPFSSLSFITDAMDDVAKEIEAQRQAVAKVEREVQAKELGLPSDVRIWKRRGGRTGCSQGWVIDANGVDRERDRLYNQNARRAERYGEGYEIWNQILPGELVIQWSKDYTAADHKFAVVHRPETMTEAQLERVAEIQAEIAEEWEGLTGLVSGEESPSIGKGWLGLLTA